MEWTIQHEKIFRNSRLPLETTVVYNLDTRCQCFGTKLCTHINKWLIINNLERVTETINIQHGITVHVSSCSDDHCYI